MNEAETCAKIRELLASGVLPREPAPMQMERSAGTNGAEASYVAGDSLPDQPCLQVQFFYSGRIVVRAHAACDALWKQERDAWDEPWPQAVNWIAVSPLSSQRVYNGYFVRPQLPLLDR